MEVFHPEERDGLRMELLERARGDIRMTGAAITGAVAAGRDDRWSDIDLFFGVGEDTLLEAVLADWTAMMYGAHQAVHHLDLRSGRTVYRVFLLRDTLQVDLAFAPAREFAARGETFRVVFGEPAPDVRPWPLPKPEEMIGMGWLYALHARACLQRGQLWRARYMVAKMLDETLALACLRHGLNAADARGVDGLPQAVTLPLEGALIQGLRHEEIARAFRVTTHGLLGEVHAAAPEIAERVGPTLLALADA